MIANSPGEQSESKASRLALPRIALTWSGANRPLKLLLFSWLLLLLVAVPYRAAARSSRLAQTYTIAGQVTDGFGNVISGATVTLSGTQSGTTTTDNNGSYSFPNLQAGGNYNLDASMPGRRDTLTFGVVVNNLSSDLTKNLQILFFVTFHVWVKDASEVGIAGVGIRINNDPYVFAQTNSFGMVNIGVDHPITGNGPPATLTPEKPDYIFNPPSVTLSTQNGDQFVNFTGSVSPIQLILDQSGSDASQAAALDSVLFLSDPFQVVNSADVLNPGVDRNTRLIIFVTSLQLGQGEPSSSVVVNLTDSNNLSYDVAAEDVRPVLNFGFTQVIFRLPDNLPVGTCTIKVKAHGQVSNVGTIRIRI